MSLDKIFGTMREIEMESSKTGKELILKQSEGELGFREALTFLLNPYIVTGISKKKINKKINVEANHIPLNIFHLMDYLKENNTGRDIDIANVQEFISTLEHERMRDFVTKFVTKEVKLGISEKTVNKVYGKDTIPAFAVQLAESFAKKEAKLKGDFCVTLKLDGNRCLAVVEGGKAKFFTRAGQPIDGLTDLENALSVLPDDVVIDGELLLKNVDDLHSKDLFQATQKVVRKDGEKKGLIFHVFDVLPLAEFKEGKSKLTYIERRETLTNLEHVFKDKKVIEILPVLYYGSDKNMIPSLLLTVEEQGHEGLMINTADGYYQTKRTSDLLKVKSFKSGDLLCMGFEEGSGRNEGRLGAILVEYKGGTTKVGSGFSDADREYYWNNRDEIYRKIVEVKYFEESKDSKTNQVSLRFPTFVTVRTDKTIADIRYE